MSHSSDHLIWFLEHDNGFTVLQQPPHLSDLNPTEHLWYVVKQAIPIIDVQLPNLKHLRDANK